jgi:hypothetical protein
MTVAVVGIMAIMRGLDGKRGVAVIGAYLAFIVVRVWLG